MKLKVAFYLFALSLTSTIPCMPRLDPKFRQNIQLNKLAQTVKRRPLFPNAYRKFIEIIIQKALKDTGSTLQEIVQPVRSLLKTDPSSKEVKDRLAGVFNNYQEIAKYNFGPEKEAALLQLLFSTLLLKADESKPRASIQLNDKRIPILTIESRALNAESNRKEFLEALATLNDDYIVLLGHELASLVKDDKARREALSPIFNLISGLHAPTEIQKAKSRLLMKPTLANFENKNSTYYKLFSGA